MRKLLTLLIALAAIALVSVPAPARAFGCNGWPQIAGGNGCNSSIATGGAAPTWIGTTSANNVSCGFSISCAVTLTLSAGEVVIGVGGFNAGSTITTAGVAISGCAILPLTKALDDANGTNPVSLWHGTLGTGGSCTVTATLGSGGQWQLMGMAAGTLTNLTSTTPTTTCFGAYLNSGQASPYPCSSGSITVPSSGFGIVFAYQGDVGTIGVSGATFTLDAGGQANATSQSVAIGHNATAGSVTPSFTGTGFIAAGITAATWH